MEAALRNQLILQHIFSHLPFRNLKQCRFVSRDWNHEIQSFIRIFRRCDANISGENPCSELSLLAGLATQVTALTMNSLTIELCWPRHTNCECVLDRDLVCDELLKKLPLRYLDISLEEDYCLELKECPAIKFAMQLLQKKLPDLHNLTLSLAEVPRKVRDRYFGQRWTAPTLPHLKVLEAQDIDSWKNMFLKLLNAAPNLQKLIVDDDTLMVDIVPKEKFSLMGNCYLCMDSLQHKIQYLEFALALPSLSTLVTDAPSESERENHSIYFRVLQLLLTSSCKTLQALEMQHIIFPLNQLKFPALVNLKELTIYTEATTEQTTHALGSIDYPTMLPVLEKVDVTAQDFSETKYVNPWGNGAAQTQKSYRPSTTVKNLKLEYEIDQNSLADCGRIFTNVSHLSLYQTTVDLYAIPYDELWAHWSQVEFAEIKEAEIELDENFDAEFLGIHEEEVDLLRQMDVESLEMVNVVPIRPSILTMLRKTETCVILRCFAMVKEQGQYFGHCHCIFPCL